MSLDAMKQALEALERVPEIGQQAWQLRLDAIASLRLAIEQAERQEPVAWCQLTPSGQIAFFDGKPMVMVSTVGNEHHMTPLYAAPPQRQPSGSFVAWNNTLCNPLAPAEKQNLSAWEDGYASGIKDQLQPLTEQEIDELARTMVKGERSVNWLARAIIERIETAAELRRLHQHELANDVWNEKTEWVQQTAQPHELGMHRADVLRQRIDHLHRVNAQLLEALDYFMQCVEQSAHLDARIGFMGGAFDKARAAIAVAKEKE